MIRRRIGENLKKQHWATIGVDLVIVVLGVFIGMQASNWRFGESSLPPDSL